MELGNDEQRSIINQWLAALDAPDWNTRATAVRMLGELGELTPLDALLATLDDEDESVRAATVRALGKLGNQAPVDRLVVMLGDPSWMVREMAALTLGELGERAPMEPLLNLLCSEHEDILVREAAKMALQQAHPEALPALAQYTVNASLAEEDSSARTERHHPLKSSPIWLAGMAQRFARLYTTMHKVGNLVEISDLDNATNADIPLTPPVSVNARRSPPLRIAEGVLVALLLIGIGMSWLFFTQQLRLSPHAGPTPAASSLVLPSGSGHNVSMTVVDGMVDVGTMDNAVYALRASDGDLLWHYNTAGPVGGPVASSPVVVDGIVYVNANVDQGLNYITGYIYALRAGDGKLLWRYTTDGYVYSPTVASGVIYVDSQAGSVTALRASDGALLWRYTARGPVAASLAVNGIVYVLITNIDQSPDYLYALRASDGKLLWRTPGYAYAPIVVNDVVYITSRDGLSALRARDGTLLWRYALAGTGFSGPTILDGVVYTVAAKYAPDTTASTHTGGYALRVTTSIDRKVPFKQGGPSSLYALRASNGTVLWHYQPSDSKNTGVGVLAVAEGLVYIDTTTGQSKTSLAALRANNGSLLWTHASDTPFDEIVVGQGVIYIASSSGVVYALQARDGKELWRYTVSGNVYSSPVLDGSTLFIGGDNGVIYALNAANGFLNWHYVTHTGS